jgi:ABC-type branched-subunit amino acid transport system ATPase component
VALDPLESAALSRRTANTRTRNVTFALSHADRLYVLEHSRVVWEGNPSDFSAEMGAEYL